MKKLTVQDAQSVVQIIDLMTQRGAVRGEELTAIAAVRQKFLEAGQEIPTTTESKK